MVENKKLSYKIILNDDKKAEFVLTREMVINLMLSP